MRLCGVPWAWMWASHQQGCLETQVLRREIPSPNQGLSRSRGWRGPGLVWTRGTSELPSLSL